MDNKFFTFLKPAIAYVDNGKLFREPFKWLYMLFAGLNLFLPLYALYKVIEMKDIFSFMSGKAIFGLILVWLIIAFAGWLGFQLWWDRKDKVISTTDDKDEFVATPVFAHFIQTFGEWLGLYVGVAGFLISLFSLLLGDEGTFLMSGVGFDAFGSGIIRVILMPVWGFLIIVVSRFIAEQSKALCAIANNTHK